jgi:hypothetical protein
MGFVWVRWVLFWISLSLSGLSHLRLSSHGSLPKALDLSRCVSDEKRKKEQERVVGQEEEEGGRSIWRNRERREKDNKKYNKKRMRNNI